MLFLIIECSAPLSLKIKVGKELILEKGNFAKLRDPKSFSYQALRDLAKLRIQTHGPGPFEIIDIITGQEKLDEKIVLINKDGEQIEFHVYHVEEFTLEETSVEPP